MNTTHIADKYVKDTQVNDDFNRYWIAYKWCAVRGQEFKCGCGAVLKPTWPSSDLRNTSKISLMAAAFHQHIKTPKHQRSIAVQIKFLEHLEQKFKKDVFYDEHDNFEKERYEEFQAYDKAHHEYVLKRRQEQGFARWLRKEEERIKREEEANKNQQVV